MTKTDILQIINQGEGWTVEFKQAFRKINKDVYDTVSAFSNREGGYIFLGVEDSGNITGIESEETAEKMIAEFVTSINNEQKIRPALYLRPEQHNIEGKIILCIYVPVSSQVCWHGSKVFDRNGDADIDITLNTDLMCRLFANKSNTHFVNKVTDFVSDQVSDQVAEAKIHLIQFCIKPRSTVEMMKLVNMQHRAYFRRRYLMPLLEKGKLTMTIPDKPKSRFQRYVVPAEIGREGRK